jgi:paxillin
MPGAELEVLMADLNSAKSAGHNGRGGGGGGGGGNLDAMLANLSTTAPSSANTFRLPAPGPKLPHGICSGCRKFIAGEMTQAMGRCYHPDHFTCTVCSTRIGVTSYFEQEGQALCGTCYHKHFSPPCTRCGEPISNQLLTALGKRWHPECFVCSSCQSAFPGGQFFERGQMPYCPSCYQNPRAAPSAAAPVVAPSSSAKCRGCGQGVVVAQALQALDALWHPEHFVCATCRRPFVNGQFYELGGQPVCPADYERATKGRK